MLVVPHWPWFSWKTNIKCSFFWIIDLFFMRLKHQNIKICKLFKNWGKTTIFIFLAHGIGRKIYAIFGIIVGFSNNFGLVSGRLAVHGLHPGRWASEGHPPARISIVFIYLLSVFFFRQHLVEAEQNFHEVFANDRCVYWVAMTCRVYFWDTTYHMV